LTDAPITPAPTALALTTGRSGQAATGTQRRARSRIRLEQLRITAGDRCSNAGIGPKAAAILNG
jgi:hypothetical protein